MANKATTPSVLLAVFVLCLSLIVLMTTRAVSAQQEPTPPQPRNAAPTALPVGSTAYKIEVEADGIYELDYAYLRDVAGMPVDTVDPNTFQMVYRGQPVAFQFVGNGNTSFEDGEAVRFYGWRYEVDYTDPLYNSGADYAPNRVERQHISNVSSADNRSGGVNVFWLWAGGTPNPIATQANETGNPAVSTVRVSETTEFENNQHPSFTNYWSSFPNEPDSWYWTSLNVAKTRSFNVTHPDPAGADAELLAEFSSVLSDFYQVDVSMQNVTPATSVASDTWSGKRDVNIVGPVAASLLQHGTNTALLEPIEPTTSDLAVNIKVHRISIEYDRLLIAENEQVVFKDLQGGSKLFNVSGYTVGTATDVLAWDVTDRNTPVAIAVSGSDIDGGGSPYTYKIGSTHGAGGRFVITNVDGMLTPVSTEAYAVPDIEPVDGADWVAIAYGDFITKTQELADYRETADGGAFTTHIVDVKDVIYQYGYGLPVPQGIKDYLHHALATWSNTPDYVLLVGDATANPRGWFCPTCRDLVPTNLLFIDRYQGQIPSDHPYAIPDGVDDVPDLAVGRMAVQTVTELDNIIRKTLAYEAAHRADEPWTSNVAFAGDDADAGGDFCTSNQELDDTFINGAFDTTHRCLEDYTDDPVLGTANEQMRAAMKSDLDAGAALFNYRGHGAVQYWARQRTGDVVEYLLNINEPHINGFWGNTDRPTVIISADCLDGNFTFFNWNGSEYEDSGALSETFLAQDNLGTAAHWSSTGLGLNDEHTFLHEELYDAYLREGYTRLGDMIVYSKTLYINGGVGHISEAYGFTLQGDPALQMPDAGTPTAVQFSAATASTTEDTGLLYASLASMVLVVVTIMVLFERRHTRRLQNPPAETPEMHS